MHNKPDGVADKFVNECILWVEEHGSFEQQKL